MAKQVVLVGHCGPDSSYLRGAVRGADPGAQVIAAENEQALREAIQKGAQLVLLNRVLDYGFPSEEGVEVIRQLRGEFPGAKMMLVSNYEEAQQAAVAAGALPGFGKREIGSSRVTQLIRDALT